MLVKIVREIVMLFYLLDDYLSSRLLPRHLLHVRVVLAVFEHRADALQNDVHIVDLRGAIQE